VLLLIATLGACSSENPLGGRVTGNRVAGSGATGAAGSAMGTAGMSTPIGPSDQPGLAGSTGLIVDSGPPADANAGCAATSVTAPPPGQPKVDIIWVVDASGSMLDEQMKIGANLTQFADKITKSNGCSAAALPRRAQRTTRSRT
jgi:hypothetical protein